MSTLPPKWAQATTDALFTFVTSGSRGWARYYSDEGAPFIRIGNLQRGSITPDLADLQRVSPPIGVEGTRTQVAANDILVSITADLGRIALVEDVKETTYINQHVALARPVQTINPRYLAWYLSSDMAQQQWGKQQRGITRLGLGLEDIRSVQVPIAPLAEQDRIVAAIEEQFSRLDAGVAALERVGQNLKRMRTAVLVDAFAYLETTLSATSGQELFSFVTSGSRGWAKYYSSDGPEFLRIGNVPRTGIDLDLADVQRVNPPTNAEGRRTRVKSGDLLVSITADLGRVVVIPQALGEAYINQHLALARPIGGAVPRYLAWYLASPFGLRQWDNLRRGATKIGLGLDDIRSLRIPIPTSDVQQSTVNLIEAAWEAFQRLEQSLVDCERRAQHLRSSVLAAAFSGKLVAQDPTDEPALALLERVAAERASADSNNRARTRKPRTPREKVTV